MSDYTDAYLLAMEAGISGMLINSVAEDMLEMMNSDMAESTIRPDGQIGYGLVCLTPEERDELLRLWALDAQSSDEDDDNDLCVSSFGWL
jgi:hypothetical protein